ncbi:MAG: KEOPS complex N(6)-L-threonylcarbamoyladenine synthase Kae1 [Candidatus Anstonellales archaeon]
MFCLGIESTAHTIGVGVVSEKEILANSLSVYRPPAGEGIMPREAADFHQQNIKMVIAEGLKKAGVGLEDIDVFSFSQGPGIGQTLRISCIAARYLARKYEKPLLGVNHCRGHVEISKFETGFSDPLVLYVSGGNTQIIIRQGQRYRILGETLDIGIGNLFDVFARELGEKAHGSVIEKLGEGGEFISMPYVIKGMNFSFSGLLTHAKRLIGKAKKEDICKSLMETSFAVLCEACERALCLTGKKEFIVCGGVAQNKKLQSMLYAMCRGQQVRFGVARNEYNADNGAMIAYVGMLDFLSGKRMEFSECIPRQNWRIDSP